MSARLPALAALGAAALLALACSEPEAPPEYQALAVERRDIVVAAEAAGVVEPEVSVEVKSKASGEILELAVETGDYVEQGELLLRIDQRQPRNAVAQAEATVRVARAALRNAASQERRATQLFKSNSMSETEYDQAVLDHAVARADVVSAGVALENARIELEDTDVLAPITGTIIEKGVERGQVISSPTRDVAGGTVLMRMADLARVRVRTLVDETDIGKIEPGVRASVVAAAHPHHVFDGVVEKIEPQAVTEQNVTMFPVLVAVDNPEGRLKPGMNAEVEVHVGRRDQVLAVPNAALRTREDVGSAARVLGLSESDTLAAIDASELPLDGNGTAGAQASRYVVFVAGGAEPVPRVVETGLTDLDYSEVLAGLDGSEAVLVLPSQSLVRSQERFRERLQRVRGDGLPGVRQRKR